MTRPNNTILQNKHKRLKSVSAGCYDLQPENGECPILIASGAHMGQQFMQHANLTSQCQTVKTTIICMSHSLLCFLSITVIRSEAMGGFEGFGLKPRPICL